MRGWFSAVRFWLRAKFRPTHVSDEILSELRTHIQDQTADLERQGLSSRQALLEAHRRFGSYERIQRECHDLYLVTPRNKRADMIRRDLRYALRSLKQNPGFAIVAILTLALGIGANTTIFTLMYGVVLNPLAYDEPEQLVHIWHKYERVGLLQASVSPLNFLDYQEESDVFQNLAAYVEQNITVTGQGTPFRVDGLRASPGFFDVLRVRADRGRLLTDADGESGATPVVVLSHSAWRSRFGQAEDILGQSIVLNGIAHDVVGILPSSFRYYEAADVVTPLVFTPTDLDGARRGREYLSVIGRLASGLSIEGAQARMDDVAARIDQEYSRGGYGIDVIPLRQQVIGSDVGPALTMLLCAVGLVLLIACVNLANLLYARAEVRRREMALRTALGATRRQLVAQLLTESILLSLLGAVIGLLGSALSIQMVASLPGLTLPRFDEVGINVVVLGFTLLLTVATGLVFGVGPALGLAHKKQGHALQDGGARTHGGRRGTAVLRTLITAEVALATILLTGAGLMLKSFARLAAVDPGYDATGVLSLRVDLPTSRYRTPAARSELFSQLLQQIRALPGVDAAGGIVPTPMSGGNPSISFMIEGEVYDEDRQIPNTKTRMATTDYFSTMRIPLVAGRTFTEFDTVNSEPVVVVDEQFVRRYLSDRDALGVRIGSPDSWATIVGVVGDVQDMVLGEDLTGHIYSPHTQTGLPFLGVVARTSVEPNSLTSAIMGVVHGLDPELAPFDVQTMRERVRSTIAHDLLITMLLATFAGVALALAAIGVYGVLAFTMAKRVNELGVRAALGAQRGDLVRQGLWNGMQPAVIGAILGVLGSGAVTRALRGQLFGVSATDPTVLLVTPAVLLGVALLASLIPVLRATRVSPIEALRS